jgi:hypothetical protein
VWETGLRSVAAADLSFSSVSAATGVIRFARSCFPSAVLCFWARAPVHSRAGASVAREEIFFFLFWVLAQQVPSRIFSDALIIFHFLLAHSIPAAGSGLLSRTGDLSARRFLTAVFTFCSCSGFQSEVRPGRD